MVQVLRSPYPESSGSGYRIPITITGSTDGELTDYQITVTLEYDSNMQTDFSDIRFRDTDASTPLSFWEEYHFSSGIGKYWVKVPTIAATTDTTTIYAYFGDTEAAGGSSSSDTFPLGLDFEDGTTDGIGINLANNAEVSVPSFTSFDDVKLYRGWKYGQNPVLGLGAGGTWDDVYVRELAPVIDEDGYMVEESDAIWAYYCGYDSAVWQIGLATSTDDGLSWSKYGSNPIISGSGSTDSWYETNILQPSVVKTSSGKRYMAVAGDTTIGMLSSTDGLSWSDEGSIITPGDFTDTVDSTSVGKAAVPSMIKRDDDTWLLVFEGRPTANDHWKIYGATANSSTGTWTPLNSGEPIFGLGAGAAWDNYAVANGHLIEVSPESYVMIYNGRQSATDWKVGGASSTDLTTWTRHDDNPIIIPPTDTNYWDHYGVEASFLVKEDSTHQRIYYHGFGSTSTNSVGVGLAFVPQGYLLSTRETNTGDGYVLWNDLDDYTTFIWESLVSNCSLDGNSAQIEIGLFDYATNPVPVTSASWNPLRRFLIFRYSPVYTMGSRDKFAIIYMDGASALKWWDGSAWQAGATYFGGANSGEGVYKVQITDDGTNYIADILDFPTSTSILANPASIAKSSVKSFGNGRVILAAQGYTNAHYMWQDYDNWVIRQYVGDIPAVVQGSKEEN